MRIWGLQPYIQCCAKTPRFPSCQATLVPSPFCLQPERLFTSDDSCGRTHLDLTVFSLPSNYIFSTRFFLSRTGFLCIPNPGPACVIFTTFCLQADNR